MIWVCDFFSLLTILSCMILLFYSCLGEMRTHRTKHVGILVIVIATTYLKVTNALTTSIKFILIKEDFWLTYKVASRSNNWSKFDNSFFLRSLLSGQGFHEKRFPKEIYGRKNFLLIIVMFIYGGVFFLKVSNHREVRCRSWTFWYLEHIG